MAEKPKKNNFGSLGGPMLGAAHRAIQKATERPVEAAAKRVEEVGENIQGRAAHRASRRGGFMMQILGGRTSPFRGGRDRLISRGDAWAEEQNQKAATFVRHQGESAYREGGVAAQKDLYIQIAGNDNNRDHSRREAAQAVSELIRTSSWSEVQGTPITEGYNEDKRVYETGIWQETLGEPENAQLWAMVAANRPDLTPDIQQAAEAIVGHRYEDTNANPPAILDMLNTESIRRAITRFAVGNISGIDAGLFAEIARLNNPTLAQDLYDRLHHIRSLGTVGNDAIGALGGPREIEINNALALIGQNYNTI